ncbi:hypothetical protein QWJ34_23965 [Saccharibacillus sp. CPCC 101409]|uniref:hypothetical protein n=1 Tax=Saccharibacillus sp. CPCC 101409 TaxID=3058041 RepID=UPI0026713E78|nr:hypothetical protein [Saccharibacillus sp. CPCC 101409]MDO3412844.1 hypothetical protein [Saccharibacillus sp. CPCC 101409]
MGQIAFWSVGHGTGVTSSVAAIASVIGSDYRIRTLVSQPQGEERSLERGFMRSINTYSHHLAGEAGTGIDALVRLARSGKLERETVKNNALLLEPGRLDLLSGSDRMNRLQFENAGALIGQVYEGARSYYDCILLDVRSGTDSQTAREMLAGADLVVICLNQNAGVLERYFDRSGWPRELEGKKQLLLFSGYDPHSKYKAANILRKYGRRETVLTVPYNTDFRDAANDGDIKGFVSRSRGIDRKHRNYPFMAEVRRTAEKLLEEIGVNTRLKHTDIEKGAS